MDRVKYVEGRKYIRADVAERWKQQRDLLRKFMTRIHQDVHATRRAINEIEKQDRAS